MTYRHFASLSEELINFVKIGLAETFCYKYSGPMALLVMWRRSELRRINLILVGGRGGTPKCHAMFRQTRRG